MTSPTSNSKVRDRGFLVFASAKSTSQLGAMVIDIVVPLIAATTLHAKPFAMGLLVATGPAATLVGRLVGALAADGSQPRLLLIATLSLTRAIILLLIPLLFLTHFLAYPGLLAISAAIAAISGIRGGFATSLPRLLVPESQLTGANGLAGSLDSTVQVAAPGILSIFLRFASLPFGILIDAACSLVAAFLYGYLGHTHRFPEVEARTASAPRPSRKALLLPFLTAFGNEARPLLALLFVVTLLNGAVLAELTFYMVHNLGLAPYLVSLITAAGALGGVGAGLLVGPFAARHGWRTVTRIGLVLLSLSMIALPFASELGWGVFCCMIYELFGSFGGTLTIISIFSWLQANLPYEHLARGIAGAALIPELGQVLGALVGATLAGLFGVRSLLIGVATLSMLAGSATLWKRGKPPACSTVSLR